VAKDAYLCKLAGKYRQYGTFGVGSIVIILSAMYAAYSEWIDFEIDAAVSYGKYIIGVKPWGQERIPTKVQNNADEMVGWNKNSVVNAVAAR
jgi:hypothetical protein